MPATSVHFNGSVNLSDAETVMREISARVPAGVRRMTEGETGDRSYWIFFQYQKLAAMPEFEPAAVPEVATGDYGQIPQLRLADGVTPEQVSWPDIGYADAYIQSHQTFRALREEGVIAEGVRLQVQYPTPLAGLFMVVPQDVERLLPSYQAAMFADLDHALDRIGHDELAVQWDVAVEIGLLAGAYINWGTKSYMDLLPGLTACVDQVPEDVPVGVHLCYGDYEHHHIVQPESMALQVELADAVAAAATRPVSWFSFTVPQDRSDEAYFAPLRDLALDSHTELSFGIVPYHPEAQAPGTRAEQARIIDRSLAESPAGSREWAVSTECGMGRAEPADVPALLDLHRDILQELAAPA